MSEWAKGYLSKLTAIEYGDNLPSTHLKAQGYPVFGANGYIGCIDRYNVDEDTVLISCRGEYSGTINYVKPKTFVTNNSIILRNKTSEITTTFLYYILHTVAKRHLVSGSAQPQVTIDDLNKVIIYYPKEVSEQQKITDILSTVDEVIEQTEAAIEKYQAIKAGMMQDLFTRGIDTQTGKLRPTIEEAPELYKESELGWIPKEWVTTEFKYACLEFINGGTPSTKNASNWVGNIPWITGADFLESYEVGYIRRHINDDALRYSSSHLIRKGNILLVTRTGVGKLAIAPFDVAISQDITGIILDSSQYCVEFFYYYLQVLVENFKKMNQGTSINGIIRSDLEATLILKPPLVEQKQIAAVLKALDESLKKEQSNQSKYHDLKIGLMADLLTYKVRVIINEDKLENS
jgi:type I restriction enzyme S subunit